MKKILFIFGTRPEVIKLAPLILEMKKYPEQYQLILCNTEQQKELSNQTLAFFDLKADYTLDVMQPNQSLSDVQPRILSKLNTVFNENTIDATIIQGDTMSVFCGALSSFYHKIPIFHVEAGLRSYNNFEPFPEEAIRQMVSRITDLHFAPTPKAYQALIQENIAEEKIFITGNTVIDALSCLSAVTIEKARQNLQTKNITLSDKLVLVTAHRRENHGERLTHILKAIIHLAQEFSDHSFVIPVHPNPNVKEKFYESLASIPNIILLPPLDYPELVLVMQHAKLILTDSGGIQEEAPAFGTPLLVMRHETERTEGVQAGFAKLVGTDTNNIINESKKILSLSFEKSRIAKTQNPYGNGKASQKIIKIIGDFFHE